MSSGRDWSNVPVLLQTQIPSDIQQVDMERFVPQPHGDKPIRKKKKLPSMEDEAIPELALYVFMEFQDAAREDMLDLDTGALKYEHFRQLLRGTARMHWDAAIPNEPNPSDADFDESVEEWLNQYMEPTAYLVQRQYLNTCVKPYSMTCKTLASRLLKIKALMVYMPGSPSEKRILPEVELKMVYFQLMRRDWQTKFDAADNTITDPDYSFNRLVNYMATQERCEREARGGHGGRHAGRGSGRHRGGGRDHHREYQGRNQQGRGYYQRSFTPHYRPQFSQGPPTQRMRTDSYRSSPGRGYHSGRYTPRAPASDPGRSREHRGSPRFFTPRGGRGRAPFSSGRPQPVRLFNDAQAVYHEDQSAYQDQAVYYESGEAGYPPEDTSEMYMVGDEEHPTEQHWAEDNFGHFSHQEEQSQYEEETTPHEPPYDY